VVKQQKILQQPAFRAKLLGGVLIAIGAALLINPTPFFIKLSVALIIIGAFMMLLITEQSIPRKISDAQIEGNRAFVKKMTRGLELSGKAVFLPKSSLLSEERVYIPAQNTDVNLLPFLDDDIVVSTRPDGEVIGISVPPAGLTLLKEVEKEVSFEDADLENVEEKLQTFVGMNIMKSITLKPETGGLRLEMEHEEPCCAESENPTCEQYPCAACSAALLAVTQAAKQKITIQKTEHIDHRTVFHLKIGGVV